MIIKPFKSPPVIPADFEEKTWSKLKITILAIHNKEKVSMSFEELYKSVQDLCMHGKGESLHKKLFTECADHISQTVEGVSILELPSTNQFLEHVSGVWNNHRQDMITIRNIFLYLDRSFIIKTETKSLWEMGLRLFKQNLLKYPGLQKDIVDGIIELIQQSRNGDEINEVLVKDLLMMLSALSLYDSLFEMKFLEITQQYYSHEGAAKVQEYKVSEYLKHVDSRLSDESSRIKQYLDISTTRPLIHLLEKFLIVSHVHIILEKGFNELVTHNNITDLSRMFILFSRVNAISNIKESWYQYIRDEVVKIIDSPPEEEANIVDNLLQLKERLDIIMEKAFKKSKVLQKGMSDAFDSVINKSPNKIAELLAKYLDDKLRKSNSNKGRPEEQMEALLDNAMVIFRHLSAKDVFGAFYSKKLSKRLLLDKCASYDAEKMMISKLKAECGSYFTKNPEKMFKDIELSKDLMQKYHHNKGGERANIELGVNVLTTGSWPASAISPINLSAEVTSLQTDYEEFYLRQYSGRKLTWNAQMGTCVLRVVLNTKNEFSLSVPQAVVLMQFNHHDTLNWKQIREMTQIDPQELNGLLISLSCLKHKILLKSNDNKKVAQDEQFTVNLKFTSKMYRIQLNQLQLKESKEEDNQTTEKVLQDRQYLIDAVVVRIMKARKSLSHADLLAEVFNMIKYPMKGSDVKKRIETLIDRDYLKRDPSNHSVYIYLA